jgi:hypothetical protein
LKDAADNAAIFQASGALVPNSATARKPSSGLYNRHSINSSHYYNLLVLRAKNNKTRTQKYFQEKTKCSAFSIPQQHSLQQPQLQQFLPYFLFLQLQLRSFAQFWKRLETLTDLPDFSGVSQLYHQFSTPLQTTKRFFELELLLLITR